MVCWRALAYESPPAAFLSVPDAVRLRAEHDWDAQRARCHAPAGQTVARIAELTGMIPLDPDGEAYSSRSVCVPIPTGRESAISEELRARRTVVPALSTKRQTFVRASYHAYRSQSDADALVAAVKAVLA